MKHYLFLSFITTAVILGSSPIPMVETTSSEDREPFPIALDNPTIRTHRLERRNTETTDLTAYYNREQYIKAQIEEMIGEEKILKDSIIRAQMCANVWTISAAITTTMILAISVIGATDYMDPRIANVIASCGAGLNGLYLWLGMQFKKSERLQIERQKKIREALGLPNRLNIPDMSSSFEQFKTN